MPLYWKLPPVATNWSVVGIEATSTGTVIGMTAASGEVWKVCKTPPPGTLDPFCCSVIVILKGKFTPEAGVNTPWKDVI